MIKKILAILMTLVSLAACQMAPTRSTPTATTIPTLLPTLQLVTSTPLPKPKNLIYPTLIPYATARAVQANAVAFLSQDVSGQPYHTYSLQIANIDGSGEKKITEITKAESQNNILLKWSPDGKWLSYRSANALWIISPYTLTKKKLLSFSEAWKDPLFRYAWSPDSSKIAYKDITAHAALVTPTPDPESGTTPKVIGVIDVATGKTSEIFSYLPFSETFLSWMPNGKDLLLSNRDSFFFFDTASMSFVKEIAADNDDECTPGWSDQHIVSWSPNGKWFLYSYHNNYDQFLCIASLDGKINYRITGDDVNGMYRAPAWDKAGDDLYLVVAKPRDIKNAKADPDFRLVRFNVKTRQMTRLLSLEYPEPGGSFWTLSISPNGRTLALYSYKYTNAPTAAGPNMGPPRQHTFILFDLQSQATKKFALDFQSARVEMPSYSLTWAPDNKNIIFFVQQLDQIRAQNTIIGYSNHSYLYTFDTTTGKANIFSGMHNLENEFASPVAELP